MSSYWFLFLVNWQLLACSRREKTRLQIHLVSEQWVTHTITHSSVCSCVCTSMRRLCISSLSVFLSCISWFCLASSSHTCWALLWQWRSNCCSLQHTHTHTHTILTERVWEERTLLANIKPNVVNIERELDPQRAFNITGLCFDQAINSVYRDTSAG